MLRRQGLQQTAGWLMKQPGKEMGKTHNPKPLKARGWSIYGLSNKGAGSSEAGGRGERRLEKRVVIIVLHMRNRLQASARSNLEALCTIWGWNFSPLMSKGHREDIRTCPVGGLVVLSSLNQLSWNSTQLTPIPGKQLPQTSSCLGFLPLGGHARLCSNN